MKLPVLNIKGKDTGRQVTLDKSIFGLEAHSHAVYLEDRFWDIAFRN